MFLIFYFKSLSFLGLYCYDWRAETDGNWLERERKGATGWIRAQVFASNQSTALVHWANKITAWPPVPKYEAICTSVSIQESSEVKETYFMILTWRLFK